MLNEERKDIPIDAWVVKIDETEFWAKHVFKEHSVIKRIFGVYMVDMNSQTYCCELTPSFFLIFLENQWDGECEDERELEAIDELMRNNGNYEDNCYVHTRRIEDAVVMTNSGYFPKGKIGRWHWDIISEFDDRDKTLDECVSAFFESPI